MMAKVARSFTSFSFQVAGEKLPWNLIFCSQYFSSEATLIYHFPPVLGRILEESPELSPDWNGTETLRRASVGREMRELPVRGEG